MRCNEVREQLVAYLDGELDAGEREIVDSHLSNCPVCRGELVAHESTDDLLDKFGIGITPERDLAAAVLQQAKEDPWCGHIRRELVAFIDGELDEEGATPVEEHLAECADCRGEHAELVATGEALAEWTIPTFDTDLVARVRPVRTKRGRRGVLVRLVPILSAACVVIIASIAVITGNGGPNPLTPLEQRAVDAGIGPELLTEDLLTDENRRLLDELDWVEDVPELDDLAMLSENGD